MSGAPRGAVPPITGTLTFAAVDLAERGEDRPLAGLIPGPT